MKSRKNTFHRGRSHDKTTPVLPVYKDTADELGFANLLHLKV